MSRFPSAPLWQHGRTATAARAAAAADRGDATAKANAIHAYVNQVEAQSGKALTADQAALLIRLATSGHDLLEFGHRQRVEVTQKLIGRFFRQRRQRVTIVPAAEHRPFVVTCRRRLRESP